MAWLSVEKKFQISGWLLCCVCVGLHADAQKLLFLLTFGIQTLSHVCDKETQLTPTMGVNSAVPDVGLNIAGWDRNEGSRSSEYGFHAAKSSICGNFQKSPTSLSFGWASCCHLEFHMKRMVNVFPLEL